MIIDHERDLRNKLRRYYQEGYQEGFQEGFKRGFQEGFQKGFQERLVDGRLIAVRELISSTEFSDQKIAALAEVDVELVQRARKTFAAGGA